MGSPRHTVPASAEARLTQHWNDGLQPLVMITSLIAIPNRLGGRRLEVDQDADRADRGDLAPESRPASGQVLARTP
jgi:hypothetical protein